MEVHGDTTQISWMTIIQALMHILTRQVKWLLTALLPLLLYHFSYWPLFGTLKVLDKEKNTNRRKRFSHAWFQSFSKLKFPSPFII